MNNRDDYYNRAKQEGYRSRAAYKLKQLDEEESILEPGDVVVDLGGAPGGWIQVAAEAVGEDGRVIGVDRQRIRSFSDLGDRIETVRGDITDPDTEERILAATAGKVTCVLSDMAPDMTGEYSLDQARSLYLAQQAFSLAREVLAPGGNFVVKVFDGPDVEAFRAELESTFNFVRQMKPPASRSSASERYFVAKGYISAPVTTGEVLTTEIEDIGEEGDGIATVEGFTVFVSDSEPGETVTVEIQEVKPTFAFASVIEE